MGSHKKEKPIQEFSWKYMIGILGYGVEVPSFQFLPLQENVLVEVMRKTASPKLLKLSIQFLTA